MKLSAFAVPNHEADVPMTDVLDWCLTQVVAFEQAGFDSWWLGEHLTAVREPVAASDLVVAQALVATEKIKVGPCGYVIPFYHPVELAHRMAQLDHMGRGRVQIGLAAGSIPTDMQAMNIDMASGEHREMLAESLQIITRFWSAEEPFKFEGKFWTVEYPAYEPQGEFGVHLKPYQKPHMPFALTSFSPRSETLRIAGKRGYIPMSLNMNARHLTGHWEVIQEGAEEADRVASRESWHLLRDIVVAETDAEAQRIAKEGPAGRNLAEYFLPALRSFGMLDMLKHDSDFPDSEVTPEYLIEQNWLVGSPETVAEKIEALYAQVGGFGYLLHYTYDYSKDFEIFNESIGRLSSEVVPKLSHLETVAA